MDDSVHNFFSFSINWASNRMHNSVRDSTTTHIYILPQLNSIHATTRHGSQLNCNKKYLVLGWKYVKSSYASKLKGKRAPELRKDAWSWTKVSETNEICLRFMVWWIGRIFDRVCARVKFLIEKQIAKWTDRHDPVQLPNRKNSISMTWQQQITRGKLLDFLFLTILHTKR